MDDDDDPAQLVQDAVEGKQRELARARKRQAGKSAADDPDVAQMVIDQLDQDQKERARARAKVRKRSPLYDRDYETRT